MASDWTGVPERLDDLDALYTYGCKTGRHDLCAKELSVWRAKLPKHPNSKPKLIERAQQYCEGGNVDACAMRASLWIADGQVEEGRAASLAACRQRTVWACQTLAALERDVGNTKAAIQAGYAACDLGFAPYCEGLQGQNLPRPEVSLLDAVETP